MNVDISSHDQSKTSLVKYATYDAYFYGNNKSHKVWILMEIFNWCETYKNMKLHPRIRKLVENILKSIKEELEKEGYEK